MNGRPNVKAKTVARVREAMETLRYRPDPLAAGLARRSRHRFCFVLPSGTNAFMQELADQIAAMDDWLARQRGFVDCVTVNVFDARQLAGAIDRLPRDYDGAAVVALDDPLVRAAIDRLVADGVSVVTLVSDVPSSRRIRFVGIDNSAAGRTAAMLVGRFAGERRGTVGVLVGSLSLRDHMERCFGFSQLIGQEFAGLRILTVEDTRDDRDLAEAAVLKLARAHPDLVAIYNAGAGNQGVGAALASLRRSPRIVVVGHELTEATRAHLRSGLFDAVIAQNPGHEVRSAARVLLAQASRDEVIAEQEQIRIDIFLRENLP